MISPHLPRMDTVEIVVPNSKYRQCVGVEKSKNLCERCQRIAPLNRPGRREAASGHSGFEAVSNVHNEVTICALKPLREGETGHAHFWIPRRQLSDRLVF